jgi:anti-anti-sigma factor
MASRSLDSRLTIENHGDRAVARIADAQFGAVGEEPAGDHLLSLLGDCGHPLLVLDFANVSYVSSIGLAALLRLRKQLATKGQRLAVLNVQPHVYEVFSVTRLDTVLDVRQQEAA